MAKIKLVKTDEETKAKAQRFLLGVLLGLALGFILWGF